MPKEIRVGQRVHCILYGGKDGTVVKIHGEQSPQTCESLHGIAVTGGKAHFDIVWDNGTQSPLIPESLLHSSVQWRIYDEVASDSEVTAAIANSMLYSETAARQQQAEQEAIVMATAEICFENPHLKQHGDIENSFKRATANIRIGLKSAWPLVKFSVRAERHGALLISWTDGPTSKQVEAMTRPYKAGHFDGMDDCYKTNSTPWNQVFGSAYYISISRDYSNDLLANSLQKLYQRLQGNLGTIPQPDIRSLNGYGVSDIIPGVNMTVRDGVWAIAEVFDCTTGKVGYEGYYRYAWLVDELREAEEMEVAA